MAFCITFGTHEFTSPLPGLESTTAQCHNCGNWSAHPISRWPWFTLCFVPVLPLSAHKYHELACPVCHFMQDLGQRPDVQGMAGMGGAPGPGYGPGGPNGGAPPPPPQGWGGPQGQIQGGGPPPGGQGQGQGLMGYK